MVYTEPRYTKDLDLWIEPTEPNAHNLIALAQFGAPTEDITPDDLLSRMYSSKSERNLFASIS